jgi:hypothetical protein
MDSEMQPSGIHPRPFTEEQYFQETMVSAPRLLRADAQDAENVEREGLMEIRNKYKKVPEEMFWEIYEYIKRNHTSVNGGKKSRNKSRRRRNRKTLRRRK